MKSILHATFILKRNNIIFNLQTLQDENRIILELLLNVIN